jgi:hypothetical protein
MWALYTFQTLSPFTVALNYSKIPQSPKRCNERAKAVSDYRHKTTNREEIMPDPGHNGSNRQER